MIKAIYEAGYSNIIYYVFHVLGFVGVFIFNIFYGKKYGLSPTKSILTTLIVYPLVYVWIYIQCWIESGFTRFGGNNIVRGFIYIPLIAILASKPLKIKWKTICDFIAPCVCVCHGISHMGCIFVGCCHGYESRFGIYHPSLETILFPVQIFEALTALLIVAFIVIRAHKTKFVPDGKSFPIMLILFGSTRFLWEFARDNKKLWLGCSSLAFHALFMFIVGIVAYIIVCKRSKETSQQEHIENNSKK